MEQDTVSERVAMLVQHYTKGNKSAFAKMVGISNQSLGEIVGARQSAPSFSALQKIFLAFPQVRMEWLILGRGPMLDLGSESLLLIDELDGGFSPEIIKQVIKDHKEQGDRLEKAEAQINNMQEWVQKLMAINSPAKLLEAMNQHDAKLKE
jgi:hypothetical protein